MGDANEDREKAAKLPEGDLVRILLTQHAEVKDMLDQIEEAAGANRKKLFEQLTTTLKAHETAEESVVRPVTKETAGPSVADARNAEEAEANQVIVALSALEVDSAQFDDQLEQFKQAVSEHAEAEETQEFPTIQSGRTAAERKELGEQFLARFEAAGGKVST